MAYTKTQWKDRVVQSPRTYNQVNNANGTITLVPQEGTVTEAGTPLSASNLNKIEQGIADIDSAVSTHMADDVTHVNYAAVIGSANAYAATLAPAPTSLVDGFAITIKINVANTGASTLNVNGLGVKPIKKGNGNDVAAGNLKVGIPYTLRYNGTNFILQGSDSAGNATSDKVLAGYTFSNDTDTEIVGSLISSPIKSIQRGVAASAGSITISSIDVTKVEVNSKSKGSAGCVAIRGTLNLSPTGGSMATLSGGGSYVNNGSFPSYSGGLSGGTTDLTVKEYSAQIVNSTTISVDGPCEWEVIEYY